MSSLLHDTLTTRVRLLLHQAIAQDLASVSADTAIPDYQLAPCTPEEANLAAVVDDFLSLSVDSTLPSTDSLQSYHPEQPPVDPGLQEHSEAACGVTPSDSRISGSAFSDSKGAAAAFSDSQSASTDEPSSGPQPMETASDVKMQEEKSGGGEQDRGGLKVKARSKDTVAQYMTRQPVCLDKDMTLLEAVKVLLRHNISGAPVVQKYEGDTEGCGRLMGVLSEEDLLWKEVEASDKSISDQFREPYLWSMMASDNIMMEAVESQALKVLSNTVGLSMSEMSISVSPDTPMSEAASIMLDARVKRLPVVAPRQEGKPGMTVVGIITRKDMLRHVMTLLELDGTSMDAEGSGAAA